MAEKLRGSRTFGPATVLVCQTGFASHVEWVANRGDCLQSLPSFTGEPISGVSENERAPATSASMGSFGIFRCDAGGFPRRNAKTVIRVPEIRRDAAARRAAGNLDVVPP